MTRRAERLPVGRWRIGVVALGALAALVGLIAGVEALRHPAVVEPVPSPIDDGDPRQPIVCPDRPPAGIPSVTSDDLLECPEIYDGVVVRYEGEAVGALLERSDGAWAQLNDDAYAGDLGPLPAHRDFRGGNAGIGVHLPPRLADRISHVGGPQRRGDVLTISGTFHRVDRGSGEVAVIRAQRGALTRPGQAIEPAPLVDRRVAGSLTVLAVLVLVVGELVVRRRRRR